MTQAGLYQSKRAPLTYDLSDPTVWYVGYAEYLSDGTPPAESATAWTIRKITVTSGLPTKSEWTNPGAGVWDNRATEAYY